MAVFGNNEKLIELESKLRRSVERYDSPGFSGCYGIELAKNVLRRLGNDRMERK